jgi:hypothetical protein
MSVYTLIALQVDAWKNKPKSPQLKLYVEGKCKNNIHEKEKGPLSEECEKISISL